MSKNRIKAVWKNGMLIFPRFVVKKESDAFVGVYHRWGYDCGPIVTSATTLKAAAKKAKLLEIGYRIAEEDLREMYKDQCKCCSAWD